jgi:2-C-methyl-D-erythritol 4-phosphate cytidylyltransferase
VGSFTGRTTESTGAVKVRMRYDTPVIFRKKRRDFDYSTGNYTETVTSDTIVYASVDGKTISELLDRKRIYAGQAPEAFRLGKYLSANEALLPDKILQIICSTEPAVMCGMDIAMIPGDENNFKITTAKDLERYESICASWSK